MSHLQIGLVDCNNFFVSCERLFRPDLNKKPVVVLSSNDGCVVARSQEIKDSGIPMGAPYFQIKDSLSQIGAVAFSSHFALYRDISRRVFNVVRRELGSIEQYSVDEAFFLVTTEEATTVAERVRSVVAREVGIPVSVGVGFSKTQAKYANALAKRTAGVCQLTNKHWAERWNDIKLSELWGVGAARTRQFADRGLRTVADYAALPRAVTRQLFGVEGERLWNELHGEVEPVLQTGHDLQKTIMSTRSFASETTDFTVLTNALLYHLHEIVGELLQKHAVATTIRVLAYPSRFGDYALQGMSVGTILAVPTNDIFVLEEVVMSILRDQFRPDVPYKKAGIVVGVMANEGISKSLFETERMKKTQLLTETVFRVNQRQGRGTLRLGLMVDRQSSWKARTEALSPDYTTNWQSLCVVKA